MNIADKIEQEARMNHLRDMAGAPRITESLTNHNFLFLIVDPTTGEFERYAQGSPVQIIQQLEKDPENSMIADVIKQQKWSDMEERQGNISFKYDDHIYMFVPIGHGF